MITDKITQWWQRKKIQDKDQFLTVKRQLEQSRKESQKLRRALRSNYRTEVLGSVNSSPSMVRGIDKLPFNTLRQIYKKSSSVRSCVDTISREVSNLKWKVEVKKGFPGSGRKHLNIANDFFMNPNFDQESFGQILSKFLTDLLVLDAGVLEKF